MVCDGEHQLNHISQQLSAKTQHVEIPYCQFHIPMVRALKTVRQLRDVMSYCHYGGGSIYTGLSDAFLAGRGWIIRDQL